MCMGLLNTDTALHVLIMPKTTLSPDGYYFSVFTEGDKTCTKTHSIAGARNP